MIDESLAELRGPLDELKQALAQELEEGLDEEDDDEELDDYSPDAAVESGIAHHDAAVEKEKALAEAEQDVPAEL